MPRTFQGGREMTKLILIFCLIMSSAYAQWDESFATQINSQLSISGQKCKGDESSGVGHRICEAGQWLITLDNINHCSEDGCTELFVPAFIAKLKRVNIITPTTIAFFEMIPKDRVSYQQRQILSRYWVQFNLNGAPVVLRRHEKVYENNFYVLNQ